MTALPAADPVRDGRPDAVLLRRLLTLVRPHRGLFTASLLLYLPLSMAALLQPFLVGAVVDQAVHGARGAVGMLGMAYLGALALNTAGQFAQQTVTQVLGQRVVADLRQRLFAKLQRLEQPFFDRTPVGGLMTRMTADVDALAEVFSSGSATLVGDLLLLVAMAAVLLFLSPGLSLGSFLLLPVLAVGVQRFRRASRDAFRVIRAEVGRLNAYFQEHVTGMVVVQLFGQEARTVALFDEINHANRVANLRGIRLDALSYAFVDTLSWASLALLLVAADVQVASHAVTLGMAVAFLEYLQRFFQPVRDLSAKYTVVQSALAASERVFALLDEPEQAPEPPDAVRVTGLGQGIRVDNVSFTYPGGTVALRHVSLHLRPGEKLALVGRTGSGKSTLTRLLLRHYETTRGTITVDGADIRQISRASLRRTLLLVPQDVHLFSGSVAENLRLAAPQASDAALWRALETAQARELVERLGGLDARVRERGQNVSLGERQLLAFARALLADPPCILLDEATASVDPATERRLQRATTEVLQGRSALIVAHRLSTLVGCDRILVLQHGAVVEEGTHAQLLARGGYYARLHALQEGSGGAP